MTILATKSLKKDIEIVEYKKKRNKVYTGADAAMTKPVITHISAVNRNKPAQWWLDTKESPNRY